MPTLARLTGSEQSLPQNIDGMDISPLFFGGEVDTDHRYLYWEFPGKQRAIRHGEWKCVTVKKGAPLELYHISEDKNESHNLAGEYPEMVKELDEQMQRMHHYSENYPLPGEEKPKK